MPAATDKNEQTFDEAEIAYLKEGLKRTYKERFLMDTRLYKIQQTMNKAVITQTIQQIAVDVFDDEILNFYNRPC